MLLLGEGSYVNFSEILKNIHVIMHTLKNARNECQRHSQPLITRNRREMRNLRVCKPVKTANVVDVVIYSISIVTVTMTITVCYCC